MLHALPSCVLLDQMWFCPGGPAFPKVASVSSTGGACSQHALAVMVSSAGLSKMAGVSNLLLWYS